MKRAIIAGVACGIAAILIACQPDVSNSQPSLPDNRIASTPTLQPQTPPAPEVPSRTATPEPTPTQVSQTLPELTPTEFDRAPEIDNIEGWINSEPLTFEGLEGKVVLVDFWTYTCVNCIRTFPYLREWDRKYSDAGLVVIGIHTPEFEFERLRENVEAAAREHNLTYPIAQDNQYTNWLAFGSMAWPTKYLIDKDGRIRYKSVGEGNYDETEQVIRELLEEAGASVQNIPPNTEPPPAINSDVAEGTLQSTLTRELYAGFLRNICANGNYVRNQEYYRLLNLLRGPSGDCDFAVVSKFQLIDLKSEFQDPEERLNHFLFLHGEWSASAEKVTHARETENFEDYVGFKFVANSANAVINPENEVPFEVRITLDGKPVPKESAGADVLFDDAGNSFILVNEPRMYRLIEKPDFEEHELILSSNSTSFALYAVTFGAYEEGP